jgi:transposase InsO family protein
VRLRLARSVVEEQLPTRAVAASLGVPYTTATEWVKRYRADGAAAFDAVERKSPGGSSTAGGARRGAILATQAAAPQAGSRRIRDVMKRFLGIGTSETTVRRVLKAQRAAVPRVRTKARARPAVRRFERAEPNQLWQSDLFTFLLRRHERIYVAAFLDDHSRYLVSLALAHHQRSSLVLEALARGIADYGSPREILTDQGRQYTAWRGSTEFEAELRRQGILHIKSRPHHPQTCGKIERFWKTLWEELLSRTVFADFEDCERRVGHFLEYYNFKRPHQGLDGATPADRFFRAASPVRAAIEATVADNALRLARAQPTRKPFYLVGRLGDRDLSINASGATLTVRVGEEETTIPFGQENDHEQTIDNRRRNDRTDEEASDTVDPEVVAGAGQRGRDRAQPLHVAPLGALGREAGDGCGPGGADLAGAVLPAGSAGTAGDARGDEPGAGDEREPEGTGVGADRGAGGAAEAPRTGVSPFPAAVVPGALVEPGADEDWAARAVVESYTRVDVDAPWRELALIWERKLCGERAPQERMIGGTAHGSAQTELSTEPERHFGDLAAAHGDRRGAGGNEDGVGSGAQPLALTQSLPDDPAPGAGGADRGDRGEAGREASEVRPGGAARAGTQPTQAREREAATSDGLDRAAVAGGERAAAGTAAADGSAAAHEEDLGSER